jgi:hypothetical protein
MITHENFRGDEACDCRPTGFVHGIISLCADEISVLDWNGSDANGSPLFSSVVEAGLNDISGICAASVLDDCFNGSAVLLSTAEAVLYGVSRTRTVFVLGILCNLCCLSCHLSSSSRSMACLANISSHIFLGASVSEERMNHSVSRSAR